nr:hypothetical protein [Rhizobium leguminosarum]
MDASATRKCIRNLAGLGFTIEQCSSVDEAIEEADIVTTVTATVRDHPVGQPCRPGIHMNAVGGDCLARRNSARISSCARTSFWSIPAPYPHRRPDPAVAGQHPLIEL